MGNRLIGLKGQLGALAAQIRKGDLVIKGAKEEWKAGEKNVEVLRKKLEAAKNKVNKVALRLKQLKQAYKNKYADSELMHKLDSMAKYENEFQKLDADDKQDLEKAKTAQSKSLTEKAKEVEK